MSRLLEQAGLVTRYHRQGSRETYHRIASGAGHAVMEHRREEVTGLRRLADRGIGVVGYERTDRLLEMREALRFWEREWPALIKRWEKETT